MAEQLSYIGVDLGGTNMRAGRLHICFSTLVNPGILGAASLCY